MLVIHEPRSCWLSAKNFQEPEPKTAMKKSLTGSKSPALAVVRLKLEESEGRTVPGV